MKECWSATKAPELYIARGTVLLEKGDVAALCADFNHALLLRPNAQCSWRGAATHNCARATSRSLWRTWTKRSGSIPPKLILHVARLCFDRHQSTGQSADGRESRNRTQTEGGPVLFTPRVPLHSNRRATKRRFRSLSGQSLSIQVDRRATITSRGCARLARRANFATGRKRFAWLPKPLS